jgi:predicted NAD/FAD-dependent oxidoreductase
MSSIAVIGAGLAGLVVARRLEKSHDVVLFEKSRGVGGRMATRRAGTFQFDHGAQFFTARTRSFRTFLEPLVEAGVVADWPARFAELRRGQIVESRQCNDDYPHYVGTPGMNAIGKALASGLDVRLDTAVTSLERQGAGWQLAGDGQRPLGEFDWVIVTAPAAQAADLLSHTSLAAVATSVRMRACYALLLGFDEAVELPWQAALVHDADISWISVNSSKPGRLSSSSLVVHSTNAWADAHADANIEDVRRHLLGECSDVTGIDMAAAFVDVHRWRYANVDRQEGNSFALDPDQGLAACGDWFVRGRVEGAFSSANALAETLMAGGTRMPGGTRA